MGVRLILTAILATSLLSTTSAQAEKVPFNGPRCEVVWTHNTNKAGEIGNVLFVNRCVGGCSVTVASTVSDSRSDRSTIPYEHGGHSEGTVLDLPQWTVPDATWTEVIACAQEVMRPYDITVTDVDPGSSVAHHESLLTTEGSEIGLTDAGIGGISQISYGCDPLDNVISFVFGSSWGNDTDRLCSTIVHEAGHAFGLEHVYPCRDPMTYLDGCGTKYFRDEALSCAKLGTSVFWEESECLCTPGNQNTHRKLVGVFGAGAGAIPPTITILGPADGDTVTSEYRIYADADDARGVSKIEFYINGYLWHEEPGNDSVAQYTLRTPANLPDGYHDIEVIAYNDLQIAGNATITVLQGAPCSNADACLDGQNCTDGRCAWPIPVADLGDECEREQDCISGICREYDGERRCSEECYPNVADQCVGDELECVASGATGICWPTDTGGGGCCSVEGTSPISYANVGLFLAVLLMLSRRRRRR